VPAIASKSLAAGAKSLREKESRGGLLNAKERKISFMSDKIEFDGMDYECYADIHGITGDCCQPDLELWELETKGGKKP